MVLIATPIAQAISPILSGPLIRIGTDEMVNGVMVHHPEYLGLEGWQWVFIAWGIPAVLLGIAVLVYLTDWPHQALWLDPDEREALCAELASQEGASQEPPRTYDLGRGAEAQEGVVAGGGLFLHRDRQLRGRDFLPKILKDWYGTTYTVLMLLLVVPPQGRLSASGSWVGIPTAPASVVCMRRFRSIWARWCCFARWSAPSRCRCFSASSSSPWRRAV